MYIYTAFIYPDITLFVSTVFNQYKPDYENPNSGWWIRRALISFGQLKQEEI